MNIEYLKLFVRIATMQNISMAGKELGLSPAVSSAHISKLEESLNIRLIHRTTRKVSLTEEGKTFLPHAHSVLESIEAARASVGNGSIQPQGKLRVSAPASFGRMHMIPALKDFLRKHQGIKVELNLSDRIVDLVEGGFDIAIRDAALNDSSMIAKKLANVNRIVCASPAYIEEFGEPKSPTDLSKHQCINLPGLENWQFKTANGLQNIKTSTRVQVDNGEAARDACAEGIGITISSSWCCYQQLAEGTLKQILKDYPLASDTNIWAVYPSSRLLPPKVRLIIDYLADWFRNTSSWDEKVHIN